ncbi:MAG: hypothetical protein HY452_02600 [Parcubacteria group bacterium]|nr:hypothetical protein [Parcubacteria group bacterium]
MTPNHAYEACQKHFPCWKYTSDLDSALDWDKEERNPKDAPYAILVKDTQAADDNLKNLSAIQIKEKGITTETLTERLLHELMYWSETKKHLDPNTITLCSGSRSRGGHVPHVSWGGDDMRVRWCSHDDSSSRLRSREVVF